MDRDLIRARREAIEAAAVCFGCGSSLAACKANWGKDPTAPPWFGCCMTDLGPCSHVPSVRELLALLKEIEADQVRTEDETLLDSVQEFSPEFSLMSFRIGRPIRSTLFNRKVD